MSKFCFYCKLELDSTINSCPQCGNAVVAEIPVLPVLEPAKIKTFNYAKFNKVLFKIAGIGMAVLLILLLINIGVAISQKPEERAKKDKGYLKPINAMIEGMMNEDSDKFLSAYPEYIADEIGHNSYQDIDYILEDIMDELKDEYGEDVKITYKVIDKEKLDKDDLKDWKKTIKSRYNEIVDITEGYELEVKMKIKGKEDSDEDETDFTVLKIDGKWYLMDEIL